MKRLCECGRPSDPNWICKACEGVLRSNLAQARPLVAELRVTAAKLDHVVTASSVHARRNGRPLPLNLEALEAAAELIQATAGYAASDASRIASLVFAPRFHQRLDDAVRDAAAIIDLPPELVHIGACGNVYEGVECEQELFASADAETVRCVVCGRWWNVSDRRDNAIRSAWNVVAPAPVVVRALQTQGVTVTVKHLENWERLGHVSKICDVFTRAVGFRVADVFVVAERMAARRRKKSA